MKIDQELVNCAISLIQKRFPKVGNWDGAAAMYTASGKILSSTYVESPNVGTGLCNETGSICEAHKIGEKVIASVCVGRDPKGLFHIVAPCGVCQERLWYWGGEVEVAVPNIKDTQKWECKTLKEVSPYYWNAPYKDHVEI